MSKKIFALCTLLSVNLFVSANGYPASSGYQVDQGYQANGHHHDKHHHHKDKITDEADERTLRRLDDEDAAAYWYINAARVCGTAGAAGTIVGVMPSVNNYKIAGAGVATILVSAAAGHVLNGRIDARAKQREEILARRRSSNSH